MNYLTYVQRSDREELYDAEKKEEYKRVKSVIITHSLCLLFCQ